jgi:hypothetical protein
MDMDENLYQGCHTFLQVWSSNANGNDSPSITFLLFATKFPAKHNAMIFNYDVRMMSVSINMSTTTLTMTQLQYLIIYSSLLRNELFISTNAKFHCTISYLPSPKCQPEATQKQYPIKENSTLECPPPSLSPPRA